MNRTGPEKIVITGIGIVTPLGNNPVEVLRRLQAPTGALASLPVGAQGQNAGKDAGAPSGAATATGFEAGAFACPVCARVQDFEPRQYASEAKLVRLMNRDAQLAVAAARLALTDAGVSPGTTYPAEEIALFGSTGMAGLPLQEIVPLIRLSADPSGAFDLARFGQAGLKAVSPILSFKILSNMPLCFVSINEHLQGPNAIYTSWEGDGARALEAGLRALQAGDAHCAVVGGWDVKTHELAFATLQQHGCFDSWTKAGKGFVPGEGAAFLVLETETAALARQARRYASLGAFCLRAHCEPDDLAQTRTEVLKSLQLREVEALMSCANGDAGLDEQESAVLEAAGVSVRSRLCPKKQAGELFAAAALLQVALGAARVQTGATSVLVHCFGHGSTQAAFVLEQA